MLFWYCMFGKPDITMACNGMLAGLVAITAPCAFVVANVVGRSSASSPASSSASACCSTSACSRSTIRAARSRCTASAAGSARWRLGIFADGTYGAGWNGVGAATYLGKAGQGVTGLLYGDTSQFLLQLGGATLCAVWAFGVTFVVFKVVNAFESMRVSREAELEGLDVPEFGMLAYPETGDEVSAAV